MFELSLEWIEHNCHRISRPFNIIFVYWSVELQLNEIIPDFSNQPTGQKGTDVFFGFFLHLFSSQMKFIIILQFWHALKSVFYQYFTAEKNP